ncbi:MAG: hypothetical protein ACXW3K_11830, partial [Brevundimonas sp.]
MRRVLPALAGLGLVLGGCAAQMAPPPPSPTIAGMGTFEAFLSGREFAGPETYLGPVPTAVVVLKTGQTARNTAFCQGYMAMPTVPSLSEGSVLAPNAIPLRWLLKAEPDTAPDGCGPVLAGYDFPRAEQLSTALAALDDAPDMTGAGPFIVEFMPDGSAVIIDGSNRSAAALRQLAPQWLALSGATVQAPGAPASGCVLNSATAQGTMAQKAMAWLQCEFPNGLDVKVMRAVGCAAVKVVGGLAVVAEGWLCK